MKYVMIMVPLLLLSSGQTYAEWMMATTAQDGTMDGYVALATTRRKGEIVKMWSLYDHRLHRACWAVRSYLS
jgi:hypothetical protein